MKRETLLDIYQKSNQALALIQVAGHPAKRDELESWQSFEILKTLHNLVGDIGIELAEELDKRSSK